MLLWLAAALARDVPGEPVPDRPFDVTHLDLAVRLDLDEHALSGTATLDVARRSPGDLVLHQVGLTIEEVTVDGQPVTARSRPHRLKVPIPADRTEAVVAVRYAASPRLGMHFRGGPDAPKGEARIAFTQGEAEENRYWFPGWDHPSDRFTVSTSIEVPQGLGAWGLGQPLPPEALDDGWVRHRFALDEPVVNYLVTVVAGELEAHDLPEEGEVPLKMMIPRGADVAGWERTLADTGPVLDWLADTLDEPYPYGGFSQVAVPRFLYGGMENPGLVVLHEGLLVGSPEDQTLWGRRTVAHEAAHQWFGDLVTCYGWRELWLNEGFATWYADRYLATTEGPSHYPARVLAWHEASLKWEAAVSPQSWSYTGRDHARVYVQGAAFLHFLQQELGADTLDEGIRRYLDRHKGGLVDSHDLRRVLEEVSGRSLGSWFDAFLHEPGHATIASRWSVSDGTLEVVVEQPEGPDDRAPLQGEVDLVIGWPERVERRRMGIGGGTRTLQLPVDEPPSYVAVDPQGAILARWDHTQSPTQWADQARWAPDAYARMVALGQLGETADTESHVQVLVERLSDATVAVSERIRAARALGDVPLQQAADALADEVERSEQPLKGAVLAALGEHEERAPRAVLLAATEQGNVFARIAALEALAKAHPDDAARIARRWLRQADPTREGRLHAAAARALGTAGTPADLALLVSRVRIDTRRGALFGAIDGAAELAESLDDDASQRRRLAEALADLLGTRELRTVQRAVATLPRVGGPAEARRLDEAARTLVDFHGLPEAARDAATALRTREGITPPDLSDLEALQQELAALAERVEALERY